MYASRYEETQCLMFRPPVGLGEVGLLGKAVTVEVDEKGRLRLPASLRRELNTQRFTLRVQNGRLVLEPVKHPSKVRGKYKGLLRVDLEELERTQERLVSTGKR